jgi:hypothetical protein
MCVSLNDYWQGVVYPPLIEEAASILQTGIFCH